jgi:hypothetical protein
MLKPHQERVVTERDELAAKLEKLRSFIGGDVFRSLDAAEQDRLIRRSDYMTGYHTVLTERIAAFQ